MNAESVVLHATALTNVSLSTRLSEGGTVFVRVIKNFGNGNFLVSFAGGRFSIHSDLNLKENTGFNAIIKLSGSKILLIPSDLKSFTNPLIHTVQNSFLDAGRELSPALTAYLKKFGLVPDSLSLELFNQMRELGMKLDVELIEKIRHLAKKFPKNEKAAAKTALALEQKGIKSSLSAVKAILGQREEGFQEDREDFDNKNDKSDSQNSKNFFSQDKNIHSNFFVNENIKHIFTNFFSSIFTGLSPIFDNNEQGVLTLFNHLGFKRPQNVSFGSWIKIPFDFSVDIDGKSQNGKGFIEILLKSDKKSCEKLIINFDFILKFFYFIVYYKEDTYSGLRVLTSGCSISEIEKLKKHLSSAFPQVEIVFDDFNSNGDFFPEFDDIKIVRGTI